MFDVIGFIGCNQHRLFGATQDFSDLFVGSRDARVDIDQHDHEVSILDSQQRLRLNLRHEIGAAFRQRRLVARAFRLINFDTAGIDHLK